MRRLRHLDTAVCKRSILRLKRSLRTCRITALLPVYIFPSYFSHSPLRDHVRLSRRLRRISEFAGSGPSVVTRSPLMNGNSVYNCYVPPRHVTRPGLCRNLRVRPHESGQQHGLFRTTVSGSSEFFWPKTTGIVSASHITKTTGKIKTNGSYNDLW